MFLCVCVRIMFLLAIHGFTKGYGFSDVDRCIQNEKGDSSVFKPEFCPITKNNVELMCPPKTFVVFKSIQFAVKQIADICTKRVLTSKSMYCCRLQDSDQFYDGECLHAVWNSDDRQQYKYFISEALEKCKNTQSCQLSAQMFKGLQRKIPTTRKYSSYIQVRHYCIKAPAERIELCSESSVRGRDVHIQSDFPSRTGAPKTCRCLVTANTPVTVRAVDVRTTNTSIILKSDNRAKEISSINGPIFGLKDIFTARKFNIIIEQMSTNAGGNVWLEILGTNNGDISITCGQHQHEVSSTSIKSLPKWKSTPRSPSLVANREKKSGLGTYTPMIYAGIGSVLTIVLTACIFGGYFICRYCIKNRSKRHPYEHPYRNQFSGQYDAVYGGMPHPPPEWMNTGVKHDQRTSTMRSLHTPMAPTLPPPNKHGNRQNGSTHQSLVMTTSGGVSDIDAFLG